MKSDKTNKTLENKPTPKSATKKDVKMIKNNVSIK